MRSFETKLFSKDDSFGLINGTSYMNDAKYFNGEANTICRIYALHLCRLKNSRADFETGDYTPIPSHFSDFVKKFN